MERRIFALGKIPIIDVETDLSDGQWGYVEFTSLEAFHKANRWLNQRGKTEKKIRSLEEEKREETEEEKHEEKSWSVSALQILIRFTEQLYEELNGKSSDRERIKRAQKMMWLQKMLYRISSERKPWKELQSGEVVFVKEAKELYDRAGRDFVAEFKRRQDWSTGGQCSDSNIGEANSQESNPEVGSDGCGDYKTDYARRSLSSGGMREVFGQEPQGIMADGVKSAARGGALGQEHVEKRMAEFGSERQAWRSK
ncbi:hypothetical protein SELMODRAFT_428736 [Selaginella moellendorffii]|uniref:Uncharacterized protein n=1 Tax=Selaginella moellendorffii TaxID=88036 RepID=D8T3U0_SELML|nr:hypothetical protein SELMODRAFT_428736 [Selaginella moellendorffii]